MNTQTRKQREIREREDLFLSSARRMVTERGYVGLNMDRIASDLNYSKGTVYSHFCNKEDLLAALAIATIEKRIALFQRATRFNGSSRERLCAIGVASQIFFKNYPEYFQIEQLVRSASIWAKASEKRQLLLRQCEGSCIGVVSSVVRDAIADGDLTLPDNTTPEELVFGLWSIHFGTFHIMSTSEVDSLENIGISEPLLALNVNVQMMLDGYHWKPLSNEHDYDATISRVATEVFPEEV